MTNRGPIHDLLPGWEPWKPEDCGDVTYGGCAGCGGDATGVDGDGLPACDLVPELTRHLAERDDGVLLSLCRCDGGEEADRFTTTDPDLLSYVRTHAPTSELD